MFFITYSGLMKFFFTLFLLLSFNLWSFSQISGLELYEKVMNELSKTELPKLEPVNDLYEQADNLMQEADKMHQNIDRINVKFPYASEKEKRKYTKQIKKLKNKSIENIILASNTYTQADTLLYSVFKLNIHTVKNKKSKERTLLAILLEKEANQHNKASKALSYLIKNTKQNRNELLKIIAEIRHLETLAITKLSFVYGLYLRWSDVLNKYKKKLKRVDATNFNFSSDVINSDSSTINKDKITFSIQLYSHKQAISEKDLDELKIKFSKIHIAVRDSWIIYSVGEFTNYFEASGNKKNEEAFIVAFKNNVKIEIDKAILLQITN